METALIRGLAAALAAAGIGAWSTTVAYAPSVVGIYDGPIGSDTVEGIGIETYAVQDAVDSRSIVGVQFTMRSATRSALRDRAEAVFVLFHAAWGPSFGGVRVAQMLRQSSADLGMSESGAYLRVDNYYLTVNRPTPNRP